MKRAEEVIQEQKKYPGNHNVKTFTIENKKGTRLKVSNCGAAVISLFTQDSYGEFADIVLGYESPQDYLLDEFYFGTVVGRYANRIAGNTVIIEGKPWKLAAKTPEYHLHGGITGFNKKIFDVTLFQGNNCSGILFEYTSPHLEEGFPGELKLKVTYTLDDADIWKVEYEAVASQTTLINLTQHSYFNLTGNPSAPVDRHLLKIPASYYLPVNQLQVPTGEISSVKETSFDFTSFKSIGKDINQPHPQLLFGNGYDHSFVLEQSHTTLLKEAAVVKDPLSGRMMQLFTTEPSVHFYSGNFLNHVQGKNDVIYNKRAGFCLETQHFPDAPNHAHFPSTVLKGGDRFYSQTIFKFSSEQR